MIITKIEPQKKHKNRSSVFLDGAFSFGIDDFDLRKLKLKVGQELTEDELENIRKEILVQEARQYALMLLDRHIYTESALIRKLKEREYDEHTAAVTITFLKEYGYINDAEYARRYVASAMQTGKSGLRKIKYDLVGKGICKDLIEEIMQEFEEDAGNLEKEQVVRLLEKKLKGDFSFPNLMKAKRYAFSRGFSVEIINSALKELTNDDETWSID